MGIYKKEWGIETNGQGTYEITSAVVNGLQESTLEDGLCNVFVRHMTAVVSFLWKMQTLRPWQILSCI